MAFAVDDRRAFIFWFQVSGLRFEVMLEIKDCDHLGLMHDENTAHSKFGVRHSFSSD
jgi:hypothetical protein